MEQIRAIVDEKILKMVCNQSNFMKCPCCVTIDNYNRLFDDSKLEDFSNIPATVCGNKPINENKRKTEKLNQKQIIGQFTTQNEEIENSEYPKIFQIATEQFYNGRHNLDELEVDSSIKTRIINIWNNLQKVVRTTKSTAKIERNVKLCNQITIDNAEVQGLESAIKVIGYDVIGEIKASNEKFDKKTERILSELENMKAILQVALEEKFKEINQHRLEDKNEIQNRTKQDEFSSQCATEQIDQIQGETVQEAKMQQENVHQFSYLQQVI